MLERQQESLHRRLTANMLRINRIGEEILQAIAAITPDPDVQEEVEEDDNLPGSDWTLNFQEQSQELISRQERQAHRKAVQPSEPPEDPYIPRNIGDPNLDLVENNEHAPLQGYFHTELDGLQNPKILEPVGLSLISYGLFRLAFKKA
ncbi:hypothetical protein C8J57DRAFT_1522581 [Mycena rebaudengoi]|nr:hypothetical protein C8J57DRAFT_1522581 [Mycena rebaudengoi]